MKILSLDIETIPRQDLPAGCMPEFDPDSIKYGNMGPEKRAEKEAKARAEFEEKLSKKMSTDPALCQVCTFVGKFYDTDEGHQIKTVSKQMEAEADDYEIVSEAWDSIKSAYNERIPIISFNGIGFDLPVLRFRAVVLDIPVHHALYNALTPRWPTACHYDLMDLLGRYKIETGKNLEFYLNLFGIGNKSDGMDGSQVYPAWQAGEYD